MATFARGTGAAQSLLAWQTARMHGDEDADQDDVVVFGCCLSGPNVPVAPNCADLGP